MELFSFYFSPTGGTKKVLNAFLSIWNCEKHFINLADKTVSFENIIFGENDLCVVAIPSFSGRVPQFIIPKLQKLKSNGTKTIMITAYGNRAFDDTLIELKNTLEYSGFFCVAGVAAVTQHSVMPKYAAGRPDSNDINELKEFAQKCKNSLLYAKTSVKVPGNVPYRKYLSIPIKPKVNKLCSECGLCLKNCPVNAISESNIHSVDKNKCISCLQCISICPKQARYISKPLQYLAEIKMRKLCESKKSNYLYLSE